MSAAAQPAAQGPSHDVTVIGCGLMGAALARALVRDGRSVAAWNRTHDRAQALTADGITPLRSVAEAACSSRALMVCLTTYETAYAVLDGLDAAPATTLVNLTTGTPGEAEDMERWAARRGLRYLDGAICCFPRDIGTPDALSLFSGPSAVFHDHARLVAGVGGTPRHVSEQIGMANVVALGIAAFHVSALAAYVEAATYLRRQGVSSAVIREVTTPIAEDVRHATAQLTEAMLADDHRADQATLATFAEGSRMALAEIQAAGLDVPVYAAAVQAMYTAEEAGLSDLGLSALSKVVGAAP
jgi:3-hydroxyisobutyrate dehydrogenase-like beta-hydroxyacid dehydrogenase